MCNQWFLMYLQSCTIISPNFTTLLSSPEEAVIPHSLPSIIYSLSNSLLPAVAAITSLFCKFSSISGKFRKGE